MFIYVGEEKFYVRGVTYGPFRPGHDGVDYPAHDVVEQDFADMAAAGVNALRTYTVPPRWLLDCAGRHGLRVMVGLAWEQHVAFLDRDLRCSDAIERRVREGVRACAGHPSVQCHAVGNEIPAPIVRWHGRSAVERFIDRLCRIAREEDPGGLVTCVSCPPGRPALVQDTGFDRTLPVGQGLLPFRTLEDAVRGAERIAIDPYRHSLAARSIAEEYFDSDRVLADFLERTGVAP